MLQCFMQGFGAGKWAPGIFVNWNFNRNAINSIALNLGIASILHFEKYIKVYLLTCRIKNIGLFLNHIETKKYIFRNLFGNECPCPSQIHPKKQESESQWGFLFHFVCGIRIQSTDSNEWATENIEKYDSCIILNWTSQKIVFKIINVVRFSIWQGKKSQTGSPKKGTGEKSRSLAGSKRPRHGPPLYDVEWMNKTKPPWERRNLYTDSRKPAAVERVERGTNDDEAGDAFQRNTVQKIRVVFEKSVELVTFLWNDI